MFDIYLFQTNCSIASFSNSFDDDGSYLHLHYLEPITSSQCSVHRKKKGGEPPHCKKKSDGTIILGNLHGIGHDGTFKMASQPTASRR